MRTLQLLITTLAFASLATLGLAQTSRRSSSGANRAASYQVSPGAFDVSRGPAGGTGGVHSAATAQTEQAQRYQGTQGTAPRESLAQRPGENYQEQMNHPRRDFDAAREAFVNGDTRQAAMDLRHAADFLRGEVSPTADTPDARALRDQARSIDELADRVDRGEVQNVSDFKQPFARSYQALAAYQYDQARQSWESNREQFAPRAANEPGAEARRGVTGRTGYYMSAAAANTRNFAHESGETLGTAGEDALHGAQTVGGKLMQGTGWTVDQIGTGLDKLGGVIHRWGTRMLPGERQPAPGASAPGGTAPSRY